MNARAKVACLECGEPVGPTSRNDKKFCCTEHKNEFLNRRKLRGSQCVDLIMAMRFDRAAATEAGAWAMLCRMASNWREEDKALGRASMLPLEEVMQRHVQHKAIRHNVSRTRTR